MIYKKFILSLIIFIVQSSTTSLALGQTIEKIVAIVDDEMILLSQLNAYKKLLSSSLEHSGTLFNLRSQKALKTSRKILLNHLIDEKILKNHVPLEQLEEVSSEKVLKEKLSQRKISRPRMRKILKKIGMSIEDYQNILYYSHLYNQWFQMEIASTIQVSDEEVNDYYLEKTGKNFFKKYKYDLHQWKFELSKKGKIQAEDFAKPGSARSKKPQFVTLTEGQMNKDLKKTISNMVTGQISKPVCFGNGCYVVELLHQSFLNDKKEKTEKLRAQIFQKTFLSKFKNWMEDKRKTAMIKKYI